MILVASSPSKEGPPFPPPFPPGLKLLQSLPLDFRIVHPPRLLVQAFGLQLSPHRFRREQTAVSGTWKGSREVRALLLVVHT